MVLFSMCHPSTVGSLIFDDKKRILFHNTCQSDNVKYEMCSDVCSIRWSATLNEKRSQELRLKCSSYYHNITIIGEIELFFSAKKMSEPTVLSRIKSRTTPNTPAIVSPKSSRIVKNTVAPRPIIDQRSGINKTYFGTILSVHNNNPKGNYNDPILVFPGMVFA